MAEQNRKIVMVQETTPPKPQTVEERIAAIETHLKAKDPTFRRA